MPDKKRKIVIVVLRLLTKQARKALVVTCMSFSILNYGDYILTLFTAIKWFLVSLN